MRHVPRSLMLLAVLTAVLLGALLPTLAQETCDPAVNYGVLAATQYSDGDYQAAVNSFTCIVQQDPNNASAFNMRGNAYRQLGNYLQAIEDYTQAIDIEADYAIAYNNLGWVYYLQKEYDKALANLNQAIELDSNLAYAYNNRGLVYQAQGNYDLAKDDFNTAIQLGHPAGWPEHNLQQTDILRESAPSAATPTETQVLLDLIAEADAYYSAKDYAQAIEAYKKVIAITPDNAEAYFRLAYAHGELEQFEQAIEYNTLAIEQGYSPLAWPYNNRGWNYSELDQFEVAIEDYTRALELDPQYARAYFNRAYAYSQLNEYEAAIADAELALENGYSAPEYAYNNLGYYWENLGDDEQALSYYNRALEVAPDYVLALRNRGSIQNRMGLYEEALADFNQAVELEPDNSRGYLSRADYYLLRGNAALAALDLKTYFNLVEGERVDESPIVIGESRPLDMVEGRVYYVPFSGETGQIITVYAESQTVDSLLLLLDPEGEPLTGHDDLIQMGYNLDAVLINYTLPATGDYTLVVGHAGAGSDGVIELALTSELDAAGLDSQASGALFTGDYKTATTTYSHLIQLEPDNAVHYYNRGRAFAESNQYNLAIADFSKAVEIDPAYVDAIHYLGVIYELKGDYRVALDYYNQALEVDPTYILSNFGRGNMLQNIGDHGAAIAAYDNVLRFDPDYVGAYHNRGISHWQLGHYEEAVADFTKAIDLSPEYEYLVYDRAGVYLDMGDYDSALADYNTALARDPQDEGAYLGRGIAYIGLDDRETAAADFMQWWDLNTYAEELDYEALDREASANLEMAEGRVYRLPFKGEKGQSVTFQANSPYVDPLLVILSPEGEPLTADDDGGTGFDARIEDFVLPVNGDYTLLVGHAGGGSEGMVEVIFGGQPSLNGLLSEAEAAYDRNDYESAVSYYNQALMLDPENASTYFNRGYSYGELGQYEDAVADYSLAIEYGYEPLEWAYHNRGWVYRKLGEDDLAIADFTQALDLDPAYALAYHNRGYAYSDRADYQSAIPDFNRVIELEPSNANAYFDRGYCYGEMGDYRQAAADYASALANGYEPAVLAYHNQGWAYGELGDYEASFEAYNAALELDPTYALAYYGRGDTHALAGEYEAAIADYTTALENGYEEPADIYYDRANTYLDMEEWALAKADYSAIIREDEADADGYLGRGIAYIGLGSRADAATDFMQWLALIETERIVEEELPPEGITVTLPMVEGRVYTYPFEGIAGDFVTVTAESDEVDPLLVVLGPDDEPLMADDDDGGDFNAMIEYFELPEDGDYTLLVSHAGAGSEGDVELTFGEKLTVDDLVFRAQQHRFEGEYELALEDYALAIEIEPTNPALYYDRAYIYQLQEDYEAAIADYTLALENDYEPAIWVYTSRAINYAQLEDYDSALAEYDLALEMEPAYAPTYFGRATTYALMEDWQNAVDDYTQALEYGYHTPMSIYLNRGNAYVSLEEWSLAKADYNEIIREDNTIPGPYLGRGIGYIGLDDRVTAGEDFMQWFALILNSHQRTGRTIHPGETMMVRIVQGRQYHIPYEGEAGQVITVTANSNEADPLLVILDAEGVPVTSDDDGGDHYNSLVSDFELPEDGEYTLVVGHAGGGSEGVIQVSLTLEDATGEEE